MNKCNESSKEKCGLKVEELWFVDYWVAKPIPRWVRMPLLTYDEMVRVLYKLDQHACLYHENYEFHSHDEMCKEGMGFLWESLRVHRETELDRIVDGYTQRQNLFGDNYQIQVDKFRNGEWSLEEFRQDCYYR